MARPHTLAEIAEMVHGTVRGDQSVRVHGVASIESATPSSITWITNRKYATHLDSCRAAAILAPTDFGPTPMPAVLCDALDAAVGRTINLFAPEIPSPPPGLHPTAVVDPSARVADSACIGPHVTVESGASIGERSVLHAGVHLGADSHLGADCRIWNNVVIRERCRIGDRVVVHPNSVIGADGFGFFHAQGRHHKIAHGGGVIIDHDVEIGACCCVDRAKVGDTRIGPGTKIDNLVQVGHNVQLGANCLLVSHVGLGGSATIEDDVTLAGYATVREHRVVGSGAMVLARSTALTDIPSGAVVSGLPARDHKRRLRVQAATERLPELIRQVKALESRVQQLETPANHP